MDQSSDIEKRIEALESWKKSLVHRWGLALFVVAVAGVFFQLQSCRIDSRIASLDEQIKARAGELAKIEAAAKAAEQTADRAMARAGDLQEAVGASQRASSQAAQFSQESRLALTEIKDAVTRIEASSTNAEASSKKAMDSSQATRALLTEVQEAVARATAAAQRAEAVATEAEKKFRQLDVALVDATTRLAAERDRVVAAMKQEARAQQPQDEESKVILVSVSGMGSKVTLREGVTSLRKVNLSSMDYEGTVYIPKGYSAVVTSTGMDVTIFISPELRGRVSVNAGGMNNRVVELK